MGDRANVVIRDGEEQVCLYTHWNGSELPYVLGRALVRGKGRWNDFPYLTRIIFCEMIRYESIDDTTGFGISQEIGDGGDRVIIVSVPEQTVRIKDQAPLTIPEYITKSEQELAGW